MTDILVPVEMGGPSPYPAQIDVPETWIPVAARNRDVRMRSFVLPLRHRRVYDLIALLRAPTPRLEPHETVIRRSGLAVQLGRLNREQEHRVQEATRWFMTVRTLGGFAHLIGAFVNDGHPDPELQRLARALLDELDRHRRHIRAPLHFTHPRYDSEVRLLGEAILDVFGDYSHSEALRDLALDRGVGPQVASFWLSMAKSALDDAAYQVSLTPLQAQVGQMCEDAIQRSLELEASIYSQHPGLTAPASDARNSARTSLPQGDLPVVDVLSICNTTAGILGSVVGNTPFGSDATAMSLAKVVLGWRTVGPFRFGSARAVEPSRDWFMRCIGGDMSPAARERFYDALRRGEAADVDEARRILEERFQATEGFAEAAGVFAAIQFAYFVEDVRQNGFTPSNLASGVQSVAGIGASVHTFLQARAGAIRDARAAAAARNPVEVPRSRWERAAAVSEDVVSHLDRPLSLSFAVINAIQGLFQLGEGLAQENYWDISVGALNTASGVLCATAIFVTSVPLLQPAGVALGIAAGLVDVAHSVSESRRGECARTYESLIGTIEQSAPSHPYSLPFLRAPALRRFQAPLQALADYLREHYETLGRVYLDPATPGAERRGDAIHQPDDAALERLYAAARPLGFEEDEISRFFIELAEGGWIGGRRQPA